MSMTIDTYESLVRRGYKEEEAIEIVQRALSILSVDERQWNCAGDLKANRAQWGGAIEQALEEFVIRSFKK